MVGWMQAAVPSWRFRIICMFGERAYVWKIPEREANVKNLNPGRNMIVQQRNDLEHQKHIYHCCLRVECGKWLWCFHYRLPILALPAVTFLQLYRYWKTCKRLLLLKTSESLRNNYSSAQLRTSEQEGRLPDEKCHSTSQPLCEISWPDWII